ncbi:WS/DGAT domain-containing protein [Reinekea blandensis]|nr:WS/DGAT domain-containing protein [Reinekea blandensis]
MDNSSHHTQSDSHQQTLMAGVDHAWLRMDSPVNPMVINAVMTFQSAIPESVVHERLLTQFASIKRFQCRPSPALVSEAWQVAPVDLDYHLPTAQQSPETDAELQQLATDFINSPLDTSRPLWRMLFVPRFRHGCAIIIRIHHAYADGMALMKVLLSLMDEGASMPPLAASIPTPHPPSPSRWLKRLQPFVPGQGKWSETLMLVEELTTELLKMGLSPGEANIFKTPGLCGKKQLVWSQPLDLMEVKTIAQTHQAKINDILLSSAAGAFRRYLKDLNQLTSWSEMRTVVPVDLRPLLKAPELGNYFGMVFLSLPLGIEDPIERAQALHQRMGALKQSKQAWLVFQILQLAGYLPDIAEKELVRLFSSKASAVMTNVPGPGFPLHFAGSELDQVLFWVPQSGSIGTGVSILTYNNRVQFGLMTDQQLISNPQDIIDCFNAEFESLLLETLMTVPWPSG